jgi:hypothetical protein
LPRHDAPFRWSVTGRHRRLQTGNAYVSLK